MPPQLPEELTVADGPLKKFEFKKGGENYWQEFSGKHACSKCDAYE